MTAEPLLSLEELTEAVETACDVAAIEVEIHELDLGRDGWQRSGKVSPLRRLVKCLRSSGLLDERRDGQKTQGRDGRADDD